MKTMILAAAAVVALGMGAARANEGEGGITAGAALWQAQNGNPAVLGQFATQRAVQFPEQSQYAYVSPPFHGSDDNGQG